MDLLSSAQSKMPCFSDTRSLNFLFFKLQVLISGLSIGVISFSILNTQFDLVIAESYV